MDRVLLAVDPTHYNLTALQKQADGFQEVFTSASIMHFGAGVRPDIGKVILAQATPPATIEGINTQLFISLPVPTNSYITNCI